MSAFAGDSAAYSPKEFKVGIQLEATTGTAITDGMTTLDVDSISMPSLNVNQVLDVRAGAGRTAKQVDAFQSNKGVVREITVEGTAWSNFMVNLLINITTATVGSSPAGYAVPVSYSPVEVENGTTSVSDFTKTFTTAIHSPESNSTMVFPGCVCTALSISSDMGTESGRLKYSATFKTGYVPSMSASDATMDTLYSAGNQRFMTDWTGKKTIYGIDNCVIQSFTLNLENDAVMLGYQGANWDPEVIGRASEFVANLDTQIKYDSSPEPLLNSFETQASGAGAITHLANHATWGSATNNGIYIADGFLTNVALSEGDVMMLDVSQKCVAASSGDLVEVIIA